MQVVTRCCCAAAIVLGTSAAWASSPLSPHDVARLGQVTDVAVSADGSQVAYVRWSPRDPLVDEDGTAWTELHLVSASGHQRPFVTGQENVSRISWTPAGEVAFLAKRDGDEKKSLYVISPDGGEARRLVTHESDLSEYSFNSDGTSVAFLARQIEDEEHEEAVEKGFSQEVFEEDWRPIEVWIQELGEEAGEPRRLEVPGSASALSWAPVGDRLALALAPSSLIDDRYMRRKVNVIAVEDGRVLARVEHEAKLGSVVWSPDGKRLAMISGADLHDPKEGRLLVADAESGEVGDLLQGYKGHVSAVAWSSADELIFIGDEGVTTRLQRVAASGGSRRPVVAGGAAVWRRLSLAPNGAIALAGDTPSHPAEVFYLAAGDNEARRLTDSNPWLAERRLGKQEVVRYQARDGLEIEGILVRPIDREPGTRVPLVLIVHGGPESHFRNGWLTNYSRPSQVLAGLGYASVYQNYRGSTGRGVEFSMMSQGDPAGKEFDDLVDGVDHLVEAGLVDRDRVGVTGASYGGYATAWSSTYYSDRFAAGVMFVGISDEISKIGTSDIPNELVLVHQRHWPWEDWELMLERSPIYHIEKARTPLLILHGKDDSRVFPGQSMELYRYLKTLGKTPVRLVLYPGEGHGNRRAASRLDYTLRLLRWMDHYLSGEGGDPPPKDLSYEQPTIEVAE